MTSRIDQQPAVLILRPVVNSGRIDQVRAARLVLIDELRESLDAAQGSPDGVGKKRGVFAVARNVEIVGLVVAQLRVATCFVSDFDAQLVQVGMKCRSHAARVAENERPISTDGLAEHVALGDFR